MNSAAAVSIAKIIIKRAKATEKPTTFGHHFDAWAIVWRLNKVAMVEDMLSGVVGGCRKTTSR